MQGKLIAGINSRVQLYDWQLQKDSSRGLVAGAGQSGLVLALYLACRGDFIVVGQLLCRGLCSHIHKFMYSCCCCWRVLLLACIVAATAMRRDLAWLGGSPLPAAYVVMLVMLVMLAAYIASNRTEAMHLSCDLGCFPLSASP